MLNSKTDPCSQFDDFYDGWLDEAETRRYAGHLAECPHCQSLLRLQQRLDAELATTARGQAPIDTTDDSTKTQPSRMWDSFGLTLPTLASVAGIALLVFTLAPRPPQDGGTVEDTGLTQAEGNGSVKEASQEPTTDIVESVGGPEEQVSTPTVFVETRSDDFIAVVDTEYEHVTVVQLFPVDTE